MLKINVNGQEHEVDAPSDMPLLWVLRDILGLTGTKYGCGIAECGACTVHLDDQPVRSCVVTLAAVGKRKVKTIEFMDKDPVGSRVQKAWVDLDVVQCGYCQTGQVMAAVALLKQNDKPDDQDIDNAMSGNICRCGTYPRIRKAIKKAAEA